MMIPDVYSKRTGRAESMREPSAKYRYYHLPPEMGAFAFVGEGWGYGPAEPSERHFHNCVEIGICRSGEVTEIGKERGKVIRAGDVCVFPALCSHQLEAKKKRSDWQWIMADPETIFWGTGSEFQKIYERIELFRDGMVIRAADHPAVGKTAELLVKLFTEKTQQRRMLKDLLIAFFCEYAELYQKRTNTEGSYPKEESILWPALERIRRDYGAELSVPQLAAECHLSEPQFRRVFEQVTGFSPKRYINIVRIDRTCRDLAEQKGDIRGIAERCGFPTLSTFNRQFQQQMQDTPRHWKEGCRRKSCISVTSLEEGNSYGIF
jgi:AraC family transcriptional regulator, activator of mtrCDE